MTIKNSALSEALRTLLLSSSVQTQDDICAALEERGFEINQSKVSRLLRKIGAVKTKNDQGEVVYCLAKEPLPPAKQTPLQDLIIDITHNESMVVVFTSPGSASLVGRLLDYTQSKSTILATVAGDDTLFILPKSNALIEKTFDEVKAFLL